MNLKKFNVLDMSLTKFSVFFITLFLISLWGSFTNWVTKTHWAWFLIIGLILAIIPIKKTLF